MKNDINNLKKKRSKLVARRNFLSPQYKRRFFSFRYESEPISMKQMTEVHNLDYEIFELTKKILIKEENLNE